MNTLFKRVLSFLARLLAFVISLLLCLPVILLPPATAVPAWAWIPLAAADLALLVLFFRLQPAWKGAAVAVTGLLLAAALAVVASQAFAKTPAITDAQGQPLPGSIATLERVTLNGSQQWVSIRGQDTTMPVLLFLAGGPGGSQLATARYALGGLEAHFVVVNWEQPGAGKSFDAVDRTTITPERYIADAHALVLHLRERFGQDKVYVLGDVALSKRHLPHLGRLHGKLTLVGGNHDSIGLKAYLPYFRDIVGAKEMKDERLVLTHIPIHTACVDRFGTNVHGHLHAETIDDPRYLCVSVEQTNYTPISLDEVLDIIKDRHG